VDRKLRQRKGGQGKEGSVFSGTGVGDGGGKKELFSSERKKGGTQKRGTSVWQVPRGGKKKAKNCQCIYRRKREREESRHKGKREMLIAGEKRGRKCRVASNNIQGERRRGKKETRVEKKEEFRRQEREGMSLPLKKKKGGENTIKGPFHFWQRGKNLGEEEGGKKKSSGGE